MYQLYYSPGACSLAVHVALIDVGADFTLVDTAIAAGKNRSPEFLAMNPRGQVPLLVVDGKPLREGAAQLITLLDTHRSPLLPQEGWARAKALEWLAYANSSMHPAYARVFWLARTVEDATTRTALSAKAIQQINAMWADVEQALETSAYVAGEQCTIADILLAVIANWASRKPEVFAAAPVEIGERTKAMFSKVVARPSFAQALASEQVVFTV